LFGTSNKEELKALTAIIFTGIKAPMGQARLHCVKKEKFDQDI